MVFIDWLKRLGETLDRGSVIDIVVAIELGRFERDWTDSKDNIIE